jgi:hypothetical protein
LALEAFGHRGSTTPNEAKAAKYLSDELSEMGLSVELETFRGCGSMGGRLLIHLVATLSGLLTLSFAPLFTLFIGSLSIVSLVLECSSKHSLMSGPLVREPSQNVVARIAATADVRKRLIVLGHYDTQRTGWIWNEGLVSKLAPLLNKAPGVVKSPLFLPLAAMTLTPFLGLCWLLGIGGGFALAVAYGCLAITTLAIVLVGQWSFGPYVPGANDNATGAAAVLSLGESWIADPVSDVELVLLITGCEETGLLGAAAFAERHADEHSAVPTTFLNMDSLGYGRPRFISKEYSLAGAPYVYPTELISVCEEVAKSRELIDAGPHTLPVATDGIGFLARGVPGVSILSFEPGGHMPNYHLLTDTSDRMSFDVAWDCVEYSGEILRKLAE